MNTEITDWQEVKPDDPGDWVEAKPVASDHTSKLMSAVSGLGQGASMGFGDELAGLTGASIESIMADDSKPFIQRYREARDFARNLNSKAKSDNPWTYGLSEVAGGAASSAPFGASAATVKGAGALGAAYGLGGSNADLTRGEVGDAALDTAKGAAIGAGTGLVAKAIPAAGKMFRENADETALRALGGNKAAFQDQLKRGTNLGKRALDEGIIGPFSSPETMLERSQLLKQQGGEFMDKAFQQADEIGKAFDPWEVGRKFHADSGDFYRSPINKDLVNQLENTTEAIRMGVEPGEKIFLSEAQKLKNELSRVGRPKGATPLNPSEKQLMAQDAERIVRDAITDSADSLLGAEGKKVLQRGRDLYGTGAGSEKLLQGKIAADQSRSGAFDWLKKPIELATSPQMRSWTGDKVAKLLQTDPSSFGKFAQPLTQALQRGPAALNSALHVLTTGGGKNSEEFRAIQRQINGQEEPSQ